MGYGNPQFTFGKGPLKRLADRYRTWRRQRAVKVIEQDYLRTAPQGQPPSADPLINAHYAELRAKSATLLSRQQAAEQVRQQTLARANDPPRKPDYVDEHGMGHFNEPTIRVTGMLPPIKGKDE